jgi:hypothetical protein
MGREGMIEEEGREVRIGKEEKWEDRSEEGEERIGRGEKWEDRSEEGED